MDRFLVGSKKSIITPRGGLGAIRGRVPGTFFQPTVTHFVVFEVPELHYGPTFRMPGANCRPLRGLR
eukprot:6304614-Pyramimonas_sp.AAC.1